MGRYGSVYRERDRGRGRKGGGKRRGRREQSDNWARIRDRKINQCPQC